MNKQLRKDLEQAISLIEKAKEIIENVSNEQREKFDNLNEGMQSMERNQLIELEADSLDDVSSELESQIESINNVINGDL